MEICRYFDVFRAKTSSDRSTEGNIKYVQLVRREKTLIAGVALFIILAGVGAWTILYQTLPGGVWHRNRLTGATCYITVHCWTQGKDPFGKGLKLPTDPFGKVEETSP